MNSFSITRNAFKGLWNRFFKRRGSGRAGLQGSPYASRTSARYTKKRGLELPFQPIRPIKNSFQNSIELVEMSLWSYEIRHSVSTIARDCFQSIDGSITSWEVLPEYKEVKIHPDVIAIANDLANRTSGKNLILGGNFLQRAVREILNYGDSFISLGFARDGISSNYHISESLYLPPLSVFADVNEQDQILSYSQRESVTPQPNDIKINPLKILHCSYEKEFLYGNPLTFQSLDVWRELKDISQDLEQAARDTGYSMLLHTLPEQASEVDKEMYQSRYEDMLNNGIVTNLYLLPGMEVKRIAADSQALKPLIELWLQKRYQCILPGLPLYLFPGLGLDGKSGKELATQPALNYARLVSSVRKILSEQIKFAISLEIVLTRGYDFYEQNKFFDISWGHWLVNGFETLGYMNNSQDEKEDSNEDNESNEQ